MNNNSLIKQKLIKLEQYYRNELLMAPDEDTFRQAYNELHRTLQKWGIFKDTQGKHTLYSITPSRIDNIILKRIGTNKKILEVGFGNGRLSALLAQQGNNVTGIDVSDIAVKVAIDFFKESNSAGNLVFLQGDAHDLKFPDNTFDSVISTQLVEHLHPQKIDIHLREVYRVLKKKGCYLVWTSSKFEGGGSFGLHLKEYSFRDLYSLLRKHNFRVYWIDPRLFRFGVVFEVCSIFFPVLFLMEYIYGRIPLGNYSIVKKILYISPLLTAYKI